MMQRRVHDSCQGHTRIIVCLRCADAQHRAKGEALQELSGELEERAVEISALRSQIKCGLSCTCSVVNVASNCSVAKRGTLPSSLTVAQGQTLSRGLFYTYTRSCPGHPVLSPDGSHPNCRHLQRRACRCLASCRGGAACPCHQALTVCLASPRRPIPQLGSSEDADRSKPPWHRRQAQRPHAAVDSDRWLHIDMGPISAR